MNQTFSDIHAAARQQAHDDTFANDYRMWKHTAGPGMPFSETRKQWDLAYQAEMALIESSKQEAYLALAAASRKLVA